MNELVISNIGPIAELVIELSPGVNVLRGANGSGKSTALAGVSRLLGGDANGLSTRDGEKRGEITLGEAVLTVTKSRAAVRGELEIASIEGRLDIGQLVDPGIADAEKADARRIKSLISLSGIRANPAIFFDVCGGADEYGKLGIDESTTDILLLGARVKRALEVKARTFEESSEQYTAEVRAIQKGIENVDLEGPCDEADLANAYARAQALVAGMRQHNEGAERARHSADAAKAKLAEMGDDADVTAIEMLHADCSQRLGDSISHVAELQEQLAKARERKAGLEAEQRGLAERFEQAEKAAIQRAQLADMAEQAIPAPHTLEAVAAADAAAQAAWRAVNEGASVRLARQQSEEAKGKAALAKTNTKAGQTFRRAALAVDDAITNLLPSDCPLRVEGGRLVTATDRSQSELYADLSLGEKWLVALRFAAAQIPEGGLLTLDQTAWESLQPSNRQLVADEATRLGISILTAEAADCELVAEHHNGEAHLIGATDEDSE